MSQMQEMDKNTVGPDESLPFIEEVVRGEVENGFVWYKQKRFYVLHILWLN